jgi:hypothetical protein
MQNGEAVIVTEPVMRPNRCAIVPHVSQDPGGFIDTGVRLQGFQPRVYVSATGARELARGFGLPTTEEYDRAVARGDSALARVEELEQEVARLGQRLTAYETLKATEPVAAPAPAASAAKPAPAKRGRAKAAA